jgi:YesN/AraC family two-component response regulator
MMSDVINLKEMAKDSSILYAEDNDALREQASALLKKFFNNVYTAADGKEALELFKKHHPPILLSDIKMPHIDGMELAKAIHTTHPETKIIIMSAFDSHENLIRSIESGVYRFLKKPVNIKELSKVLYEALMDIRKTEEKTLFYAHLHDIFNYQSAMVVMLKGENIELASPQFLKFFNVESIEEFIEKRGDIGVCMLKHDGFLYNTQERDWFEELSKNQNRLYHVKMIDDRHEFHHFILKFHNIPQKQDYFILSFDDITELNLLGLFDSKKLKDDKFLENQKAIKNLFEVVMRNSAKVKLHNFYRGLSIANDAIITKVEENNIHVKSNITQQKAILYDKKTIISSEAMPSPVLCEKVIKNDIDQQHMIFSACKFIPHSALERRSIRVEPDSDSSITLIFNGHKFLADIKIVDISIDAIKLAMNAIPAGLEIDEIVTIDLVLSIDRRKVIINTEAKLFKKNEINRYFYLVFFFVENSVAKRPLTEYISKRQMQLIREFKGLKNV